MSRQGDSTDAGRIELAAPHFVDAGPRYIAGLRVHHEAGNGAGIPAQWRRFATCMHQITGRSGDATYGVVAGSTGTQGIDYLTGVEVQADTKQPHGFSAVLLPAGRYVVFEHSGHVSRLSATCEAIFTRWLPESGYRFTGGAPFFERYAEEFDPATGLGVVEIWLSITP